MAKLDSGTVIWDSRAADFGTNRWLDSHVVGNGKIGAAMTGATSNEAILINHADLRDGGKTQALQDISDKFPQVRKLYNEGKVFEAEALLSREFEKKGYNPHASYQIPVCVLNLNFTLDGFPTDYKRLLDMESAEATARFNIGQTLYERNLFVARNSDIVVFNAKGKASLNAFIEGAKHESNWIYFCAKTNNGDEYGLVARIVATGGLVAANDKGVFVEGADNIMVLAKPFIGSSKDEFAKIKKELEAIKLTYAKLHSASEAIHRRLFAKTGFELGNKTGECQRTLLGRVFEGSLSPTLLERLWNFAKYLSVICDDISPSGLWLGEGKSEEFSLWNNAAQLFLQGDAVLELLAHYEKYSDDLRKNASRVFGATGYFVPDKIAPGSALFGSAHASTLHFVASSAMAANLFYSYYLQTGDVKALKTRIFPFMRNVIEFYGDFLKLDNNGQYTTIPSYSPTSTPGNTIQGKRLEDFYFATNSAIDFLAIGALLDNLIHASEALGDKEDILLWGEMKGKLPKLQANENGGLREYVNSAFADGRVTRGNLHLYGLYPLKTLSFNDYEVKYQPKVSTGTNQTISLRQASVNSVGQKLAVAGSVQDAKTLGMYAAQMAHSRDPELARDLVVKLLSSVFTSSGLSLSNDWRGGGFTQNKAPTLDICGNFGLAAALTESIIQSNHNTLRILPSAYDELTIGEITDWATDFGAKVSMVWNMHSGRLNLKITPKHNCKINIEFNEAFRKPKNKEIKLDGRVLRGVELGAGKTWIIEF